MKLRLILAGSIVLMASVPATSHAFVCAPEIRDVCDTVCTASAATRKVCSLFG